MRKILKNKNGITLIALVITIVVLLILAGVSIATLIGDNGILTQAGNSKEQYEISEEKEILEICIMNAIGKDIRADITKEVLENELKNYGDNNFFEVLKDNEDLYVYFIKSNRYYMIDSTGNLMGPVEVDRATDKYPGDITKDINGNELTGTTEEDAYQINCIEDLCAFSNSANNGKSYKNLYIQLMRNLDFKSDFSYINGKIEIEGYIMSCNSIDELKKSLTENEGFISICAEHGNFFSGKFNGNYYTISNLYENYEDKKAGGLFGHSWYATIKNITVEGKIKSNSGAAGITKYARDTQIINCINRADIYGESSSSSFGGIVGHTYIGKTKIINCINYGNIEGFKLNGGILGWDWSGDSLIYNCCNFGEALDGIVMSSGYDIANGFNVGSCARYALGYSKTLTNGFYLLNSAPAAGNDSAVGYSEIYMKSREFVNELNTFISTNGNDSGIDTTGLAKWQYNQDEYPTLNFKNIWNGTDWQSEF